MLVGGRRGARGEPPRGRRCDGGVEPFAATSREDCENAHGWCPGQDTVRTIAYDGQEIFQRADSCTNARYCCALCNNRSDYHRVEGIDWACADAAGTYCSESDRGGLNDADWRYCTP